MAILMKKMKFCGIGMNRFCFVREGIGGFIGCKGWGRAA